MFLIRNIDKMNVFYLIIFFSVVCLTACSRNEKYFVREFNKKEDVFNDCVKYIERHFINNKGKSGLSRMTILDCGDRNIFMPDDYRMCDSVLERHMIKNGIMVISIEKDVCYKEQNFDLIIFEMGNSGSNNYYYYYSFCNSYSRYADNSTITNIPLERNWSLFIEKR